MEEVALEKDLSPQIPPVVSSPRRVPQLTREARSLTGTCLVQFKGPMKEVKVTTHHLVLFQLLQLVIKR